MKEKVCNQAAMLVRHFYQTEAESAVTHQAGDFQMWRIYMREKQISWTCNITYSDAVLVRSSSPTQSDLQLEGINRHRRLSHGDPLLAKSHNALCLPTWSYW